MILSKRQIFKGVLKKEIIQQGSKSEHVGMVLIVNDKKYRIVRVGKNPFMDDELEKLEGSCVVVEGDLIDRLIRAEKITMC